MKTLKIDLFRRDKVVEKAKSERSGHHGQEYYFKSESIQNVILFYQSDYYGVGL
jgi:hypothetical protein